MSVSVLARTLTWHLFILLISYNILAFPELDNNYVFVHVFFMKISRCENNFYLFIACYPKILCDNGNILHLLKKCIENTKL